MKIKVALIQFRPELGKTDENISKIRLLLDQASGARLIVLPELASSGYNFLDFKEAMAFSEELENSPYVDFLVEMAEQHKTFIVSGISEKEGDRLYNTSVVAGPSGILAKYRKIHLFMNEKDIFQKGDGNLPVVDIDGCKVGMLICFDYLFPEIWRKLAMKGADVICHPSNILTQNALRCLPALSLMNRIYILTTNRIGEERGLIFNGQSCITNPLGELIKKASDDREQVILARLDTELAHNKWVTPRNHVFDDRRPEIYNL